MRITRDPGEAVPLQQTWTRRWKGKTVRIIAGHYKAWDAQVLGVHDNLDHVELLVNNMTNTRISVPLTDVVYM